MIEKDLERLGKYAEWICQKYGVAGYITHRYDAHGGNRTAVMTVGLRGDETALHGDLPDSGLTKGEKPRWLCPCLGIDEIKPGQLAAGER